MITECFTCINLLIPLIMQFSLSFPSVWCEERFGFCSSPWLDLSFGVIHPHSLLLIYSNSSSYSFFSSSLRWWWFVRSVQSRWSLEKEENERSIATDYHHDDRWWVFLFFFSLYCTTFYLVNQWWATEERKGMKRQLGKKEWEIRKGTNIRWDDEVINKMQVERNDAQLLSQDRRRWWKVAEEWRTGNNRPTGVYFLTKSYLAEETQ